MGGPSNLSREAGTFDGLRSLLDLVLVTAAMSSDHLTGPCLHVHRVAPVGVRERRQAQGQQQPPQTHSTKATTTFPHSVGAVWCRLAQQVKRSPHSRYAPRHGGQPGIPRRLPRKRATAPFPLGSTRACTITNWFLEKQEKVIPSSPNGRPKKIPRIDEGSTLWLLPTKVPRLSFFYRLQKDDGETLLLCQGKSK